MKPYLSLALLSFFFLPAVAENIDTGIAALPPKSYAASSSEVEKWEKTCSSSSNANACYNLGVHYAQTLGSDEKAIPLYQKACAELETLACYNLGGLLIKAVATRGEGAKAFGRACKLVGKTNLPSVEEAAADSCRISSIITKNISANYLDLLAKIGVRLPPTQLRSADGPSELTLPNELMVTKFDDHQTLGKLCKADREWIEFKSAIKDNATAVINQAIRKEMSVGKKLSHQDCPYVESGTTSAEADADTQEYLNRATLTGSSQVLVGVETEVHFQGAHHSGTHIFECEIYQLVNGQKIQLRAALTAAGKAWLAEQSCRWAKSRDKDRAAQLCQSYAKVVNTLTSPGFRFCLVHQGVDVRFRPANLEDSGDQLIVPAGKLANFFHLPPLQGALLSNAIK